MAGGLPRDMAEARRLQSGASEGGAACKRAPAAAGFTQERSGGDTRMTPSPRTKRYGMTRLLVCQQNAGALSSSVQLL